MSILNYFKAVSISVKMQKLYKRINEKAAIMDTENGESKIEKISVKEFTKWYSSKLKTYEEIINEAENNIGLKCVCEKGCSACCMQAIYINPAEYAIIKNMLNN